MLKLLKYNWKMNSLSAYIVMASTFLLYALMLVGNSQWGWIDEAVFVFGNVLAALSWLIFIVITCLSFKHQLKSYQRRLLPISPIAEIASILLLGVIYSSITAVLALGYFSVLNATFNYEEINQILDALSHPEPIISIMVFVLWQTITLLVLIMLAMATTYSFRGKYRAWIGVVVFIGVSIITDYLYQFFAGDEYDRQYGLIRFEAYDTNVTVSEGLLPIDWFNVWSFTVLIDVVVLIACCAGINYLMKKRIQL